MINYFIELIIMQVYIYNHNQDNINDDENNKKAIIRDLQILVFLSVIFTISVIYFNEKTIKFY